MNAEDRLKKKLNRIKKWVDACDHFLLKETPRLEELYRESIAELEAKKTHAMDVLSSDEIRIRGELDAAGKEFSRKKYQLERDTTVNRAEIQRMDDEMQEMQKKYQQDLTRLSEDRTALKVSYERQISALTDLYQEKRRHLNVARAGLFREWQSADVKLKETKEKAEQKLRDIMETETAKINHLKDQATAKREGWATALETMKRELEALTQEKTHLEKRISEIRGEKEKELDAAKTAMAIGREQLEIDKATLIEKAEDEQRKCEAEVADLKAKIESAERDLQDFLVKNEVEKKDTEEGFVREECLIKETLKTESEKRDYEQKLFEQEKNQKEKELNRLREEYEKKKWHWDNQVRSLLMQKSVQDSEHEATKIRVDREARVVLRSLEAKRDELRQRLADLKSRHKALEENAQKETGLIHQRWQWRRDRLWAMWQNRLDVLRKEREALHEQMEALQQKYESDRRHMAESENREVKRSEDMEKFILQTGEQSKGQQKQRQIQFELEKTRLFTQIKECESVIGEWMDRLKQTQEEVRQHNTGLIEQMNYLDRWHREEEAETQLFLQSLQGALTTLEGILNQTGSSKANAA